MSTTISFVLSFSDTPWAPMTGLAANQRPSHCPDSRGSHQLHYPVIITRQHSVVQSLRCAVNRIPTSSANLKSSIHATPRA
jgi:hypothetical protein